MARTKAIGLRRDPQPAIPMVMPSESSDTTSSMVMRLSGMGVSAPYWSKSASRLSTNAWRASSATPERLSSNVKPCSKR